MKQIGTYYLLACAISWLIWLPLYGPSLGLGPMPTLPYHHALGGLGPMMAAFLTNALFRKKSENLRLLQSLFKATPLILLLVALLSPFVLAIIAAALIHLINGTPLQLSGLLQSQEAPHFNLAVIFLYNLVFFGYGEEVGWRGFVLPRLQGRFNALASSLLLTALWALWHWPLFLYRPGYSTMELAGIVGWIASLFTGSVLLTWLYNSSRGSVLICAVFHATIDIPFTSRITDAQVMQWLGFLITLWGIITLIVFKARHLSRKERVIIT